MLSGTALMFLVHSIVNPAFLLTEKEGVKDDTKIPWFVDGLFVYISSLSSSLTSSSLAKPQAASSHLVKKTQSLEY